jgi:hypothetical protein
MQKKTKNQAVDAAVDALPVKKKHPKKSLAVVADVDALPAKKKHPKKSLAADAVVDALPTTTKKKKHAHVAVPVTSKPLKQKLPLPLPKDVDATRKTQHLLTKKAVDVAVDVDATKKTQHPLTKKVVDVGVDATANLPPMISLEKAADAVEPALLAKTETTTNKMTRPLADEAAPEANLWNATNAGGVTKTATRRIVAVVMNVVTTTVETETSATRIKTSEAIARNAATTALSGSQSTNSTAWFLPPESWR